MLNFNVFLWFFLQLERHCLLCLKASALFKMSTFVFHVKKKVVLVHNVEFSFLAELVL